VPSSCLNFNDSLFICNQVASHTDVLGANPSKGFLIGGTSAGANLAAVASHLAQMDNITPSLTGVFLQIPATANPEAVPPEYKDMYLSREQLRNAPILSGTAVALFEGRRL
jgi:acetyl esterase/lipase